VPNILAILRQWVPQVSTSDQYIEIAFYLHIVISIFIKVQLSVEFLINEALRRGAHPDDRDSVTDMTLLVRFLFLMVETQDLFIPNCVLFNRCTL